VFLLAVATFSTIYLTQPVLPVLREEFGIDAGRWLPREEKIPVAAGILEARLDRPGREGSGST
jgi:hypothetical protein